MPRTTCGIICQPTPAPLAGNSLIQHQTTAHTARRQPHPAEIRRWRRQSVQMGRKICVCLSRCNPWRDISSGVGNSSAQTVDAHVPREWEGPASGALREGWSEAEVCAEKLPLCGRQGLALPSTKSAFLCSGSRGLAPGKEEISFGKHNNGLPANHRAHFRNTNTS